MRPKGRQALSSVNGGSTLRNTSGDELIQIVLFSSSLWNNNNNSKKACKTIAKVATRVTLKTLQDLVSTVRYSDSIFWVERAAQVGRY